MNYFPLTRSFTIRFLHIVIKKSTLSTFNVDFLLDLSEVFIEPLWIVNLNLSH